MKVAIYVELNKYDQRWQETAQEIVHWVQEEAFKANQHFDGVTVLGYELLEPKR